MKYIVLLFFLLVSVVENSSLLKSQRHDVLRNLEDSITDLVKGKEFLYYTKGHHGHIWSLAISDESNFFIVSGNTRNNDCRIDTISANESVLKWGLDTMSINFQKMRPTVNSTYWPFHERLILFSPKNEIIIDCNDTNTYSGINSVTFNKKLNKLKYLMYWFATPTDIQEKLPTP